MALSPEHAQYLAAQAVDVKLAESLGVRTVEARSDMVALGDSNWENFANFPAILFPWTSPDGEVMYQARPDTPTVDQKSGKPRKYVFGRGETPVLWAVREVDQPRVVVIVEGTKQCLAAGSYAPADVSIYGIAGCRMWQVDGNPIPDLGVADGHDVVVILDADAATNPEVYEAGTELATALIMEGASKVIFARLPGGKAKSGLDDILAGRPETRRADYLARVIREAKPKPADKLPSRKKGPDLTGSDGRATVVVNEDRFVVINDLTDALLKRWNARELFCHGGVISRRTGADTMTPVDKGSFHDLIQTTAKTVIRNEGAQGTTYSFSWPDAQSMSAVLSRADQFATLERLAHAPFVRPDGTIVTEPGYDEATRTLLMRDEIFAGIEVPDEPNANEIRAARDLILSEWLGDFPLETPADRANLLGLVLTPAIRGMVPRAPMAVIDGLQMGVGKNLLADSLLTVYTGRAAEPMNWVDDADELRKQITSAFRTGAEFFVFDEAHTLEGAALAQALTAETWQDRILGVSTMANFPNRVTWISLGNNVNVRGDITRRVYRVALRPTYANPQDRAANTFRHPGTSGLDLRSWTRKHRRELMTAILTLVRAWFAQGQPYPKRGVSFGSFESWERIVGGIVENAGLDGFLDNLRMWRTDNDFDSQYWAAHLTWLREEFGTDDFRTVDVRNKAMTDPLDYAPPPRMDDMTDKAYGRRLGEAYSRIRGRRFGGFWIERSGQGPGHVNTYVVLSDDDLPPAPGAGPDPLPDPKPGSLDGKVSKEEGTDPEPAPEPPSPDSEVSTQDGEQMRENENENAEARGPAPEDTDGEGHDEVRGPAPEARRERGTGVVAFDLETGDAAEMHRAEPKDYIRIGATADDEDGEVVDYTGVNKMAIARSITNDIRRGEVITGHNIMAFDLPVLVRTGAMTMPEVHQLAADGRLFDGLLAARYLDPPMARDTGVDHTRRYDLGRSAEKYGLSAKLVDTTEKLKKKYKGWNDIPWDTSDPDPVRAADAELFRLYLRQDARLSRQLYSKLLNDLGGSVPEYLAREHRIAAIGAQISLNGFLVDQPLLAERITQIEETRVDAMRTLAGEYGVPTANEKGVPYKSPLASKVGKQALESALVAAGVPAASLWRTQLSGELQVSADAMLHYGREYGQSCPGVRDIAKAVYRIVSLRSVYEMIHKNIAPDGRVHPKIGFEQATGRWSLTSPGLTVMGKRGGRHVERAVLLPDPGEVVISADLSQVDMRAVAGLSQDQAYIAMLKREDPHRELAVALFGDGSFRETAKAIGHGWNYGESLRRISTENEIDHTVVSRFDQSMRDRFPRLVEWREEVRAIAGSGQLLENGFGRFMRPDPQRAHTQGPALMGQGAARDIMMTGLLRLDPRIMPMLRAQIHDEIVLSVPEAEAEEIGRAVVEALSFEWKGVPITADVSRTGTDWSKCYEKG